MKKANLLWSLLLMVALFFSGPLSQTAFAHYVDQAYEEEMLCEEEEEQPCNRSLWIGGGVLGLAAIGAIACTLSKSRNHHKGCHQNHCCNEVPDNGGGGAGGALTATFTVTYNVLSPLSTGVRGDFIIANDPSLSSYKATGFIFPNSPTLNYGEISAGTYVAYLIFPIDENELFTFFEGTLKVMITGEFGITTHEYTFSPPTYRNLPEFPAGYVSEVEFTVF